MPKKFEVLGTSTDCESRDTARPAATNLVPNRLNGYSRAEAGGNVRVVRGNGWDISIQLKPEATQQTFAGYCWHFNDVDGRHYEAIRVAFSRVPKRAELRFELSDGKGSDWVLAFPNVPDVRISMTNYDDVQRSINRFCLLLVAPESMNGAPETEFTLTDVHLE